MNATGWMSAVVSIKRRSSPILEAAVAGQGWSSARSLPLTYNRDESKEYEALTVYIQINNDAERTSARRKIEDILAGIPSATLEAFTEVENENWELAWQQYFHPINIGRRLRVRPPWESALTTEDGVDLIIRPGMGFGTGNHATTQLLLGLLVAFPPTNARVLDYGCGSGILAIAAAKLGAKSTALVDIDQDALDEAAHNVNLNNSSDHVETITDVLDENLGHFDLILANITAPILTTSLPVLRDKLLSAGQIWVSGILEPQLSRFLHSARQHQLDPWLLTSADEWVAIILDAN